MTGVASKTPRVLVKVCGIRRPEDARACVRHGVDYAGLNFVPGARRCITMDAARSIREALGDVVSVGVVRNQSIAEMRMIAASKTVGMLQLHGDETPGDAAEIASSCAVVKAIDMRHVRDPGLIGAFAETVKAFVVDGREPGSGKAWRWSALQLVDGKLAGVPVWLAGGLRPDNVGDAIAAVAPAAVDVASGIESLDPKTGTPRVDEEAIAAFVAAARGAATKVREAS